MIKMTDGEEIIGSALFRGMDEKTRHACLDALRAREKCFARNSLVLHAGEPAREMGLVLSGSVTIETNDLWGSCTVLGHVGAGGVFAESYALLPGEVMPVDVRANEETRVLLLNVGALKQDTAAPWQNSFYRNLLTICANKNRNLTERSFHTAPKSIRGRVLSYLNAVAVREGKREFTIPFDRQQLADYLGVERTALSKELGRMREEGILTCRKNRFRLLDN